MRIKKTLLSALAVTLLLAGCGTKQTTPQSLSLKEAFGDKFLVGVALNTRQVAGKDSAATRLIKQHFNSIVAENCMKSVNAGLFSVLQRLRRGFSEVLSG